MWRPWAKAKVKIHTRSPSPSFSCSSFKDVHHLLADNPTTPISAVSPSEANKPSNVYHRVRRANSLIRSWSNRSSQSRSQTGFGGDEITIPGAGAETCIVVYFTSLHVVRTTFEECRAVRSILNGFRVRIDERDLSMDASFASELRILFGKSPPPLPRIFIGGKYVGGAEEVKQLNEIGELRKMVEGFAALEPGVCEMCGDYGFIMCNSCHGSRKVYLEKSGLKSCSACNENGLVKCTSCTCVPYLNR